MRRVALAIVATVAGLVTLLSFKTHTASVAGLPVAVSTAGPGETGTSTTPVPSSTSSAGSTSSSTKTGTKTVTGDVVNTRWGPVQVQITVTDGKLTKAAAVEYPNENPRDQQINAYAIPQLTQETLAAGSAQIDMVSGATYTSQGYIGSLQSALDKAGL